MRNNKRQKSFILIPVIAIILLVLWRSGLTGIWTQGISYITNNTKNFTDTKGYILEGKHSIAIDLSNLESNVGKDLYNDGAHRVYVDWIDNTGSAAAGGYKIVFRTSGKYSLNGASLVSGIHHDTVNGNSLRSVMSADMTAKYKGEVYDSSVSGTSGVNYKDGDAFSFYIFPNDAYEKDGVSLSETGIVELTVKDIYKNIWSKK